MWNKFLIVGTTLYDKQTAARESSVALQRIVTLHAVSSADSQVGITLATVEEFYVLPRLLLLLPYFDNIRWVAGSCLACLHQQTRSEILRHTSTSILNLHWHKN